jgi:hypothetical protein
MKKSVKPGKYRIKLKAGTEYSTYGNEIKNSKKQLSAPQGAKTLSYGGQQQKHRGIA